MEVKLKVKELNCIEIEFKDLLNALLGVALLNNFEVEGVKAIVSFS